MGGTRLNLLAVLIYGVLAAFGLALIAGLWLLVSDIHFARAAVRAEAEIIEIDYHSVPGRAVSTNSFPTFAFLDQNGEPHQVKVAKGWSSHLQQGDWVEILYNPAAPEVKIETLHWRWWKGFGALLTGIAAPFWAIVLWRWRGAGGAENHQRLRRNRLARERRARLKAERQAQTKNGVDD